MIIRPRLQIRLLPGHIHRACLRIRIIILRFQRFRILQGSRWDLSEPFTGVPDLEDDVEDLAVDLPGGGAEDVEGCVEELEVAEVGGFF